jgi:PTH1 family peptidyl-tRNA hydrolase
MILVAGLGNPGKDYSFSRHNIGFMAVDELADRLGAKINKRGFRSLHGEALVQGKKLILLKPQTYMNLSGQAVSNTAGFFKIPAKDIIVVYDEMDLALGGIRIRVGGGSAGHKGIESIIMNLGNPNFIRVRIGIGKPVQKSKAVNHVLSGFKEGEKEAIKNVLTKAADAILEIILNGVESAMNKFNRREEGPVS